MMIGKAENTSASYIDPTADAMRASAERAAQTKQDVQKSAAEGLLETNAVYQLDISEEGWARMEAEKRQRTDEQGNPITDGKLENVIYFDTENWPSCDAEEGIIMTLKNSEEIAPLSQNMFNIEQGIVYAFEMAKRNDGGYALFRVLRNLGMSLNAYSHKQREAIASGRDTYLQSLSDRLDQMDNRNPVVWRVRELVDMAQRGREIDVWGDEFEANAKGTWKAYQEFAGLESVEEETKPEALFNEKTAMYCYMQKLARWQAERDGDLVEEMTGADGEEKENHAVGEILRDTSMEDGLQAIQEHRARVRKCQHEDGSDLTEEEWDKENEGELLYAAGYDWNVICKQYLKENPDVAAAFAAYGDPYKTSWN